MNIKSKKDPKNFRNLKVYQISYNASIEIMKNIIPKLPELERNDLRNQMSRSSKAIPRLIAEGYAKKHQRKGFQKYLDDANGESNEMIVCLYHCHDLYSNFIEPTLCLKLSDTYDQLSRQIYKLSHAWRKFKENHNDRPKR
jgi:four helix bundle protein